MLMKLTPELERVQVQLRLVVEGLARAVLHKQLCAIAIAQKVKVI